MKPCSLDGRRPVGVYVGAAFRALRAAGDTPKGDRMSYRGPVYNKDKLGQSSCVAPKASWSH